MEEFDGPYFGQERDPSLSSFYGPMDPSGHVLLGAPEESVSPEVEWAAPINDLLYSPHYGYSSNPKSKARNDPTDS